MAFQSAGHQIAWGNYKAMKEGLYGWPILKTLLVQAITADCETASLMALNQYLLQNTKED